jgi:hypothetical protein
LIQTLGNLVYRRETTLVIFTKDLFLENSGTLGSSYNLTNYGAIQQTSNVATKGEYASLNKTYLQTNSNIDTSQLNAVSVAFWMQLSGLNLNSDTVLINDVSVSSETFKIQRNGTTDYWSIECMGGVFTTDGILNDWVVDNTWNHYIFVFDNDNGSTRLNMYKNGVSVFTNTNGTWSSTLIAKPILGHSEQDSSLIGNIDEVRLYDRILTVDEVSELYNYVPGTMVGSVATTQPTIEDSVLVEYPRENLTSQNFTYSSDGTIVNCKASSTYQEPNFNVHQLFNGKKNGEEGGVAWASQNPPGNDWIMVDLGEKIILKETRIYPLQANNVRQPREFKIYGTNDINAYLQDDMTGSWDLIYEGTNPDINPTNNVKIYDISTNVLEFRYYSLVISSIYDTSIAHFEEWELYGTKIVTNNLLLWYNFNNKITTNVTQLLIGGSGINSSLISSTYGADGTNGVNIPITGDTNVYYGGGGSGYNITSNLSGTAGFGEIGRGGNGSLIPTNGNDGGIIIRVPKISNDIIIFGGGGGTLQNGISPDSMTSIPNGGEGLSLPITGTLINYAGGGGGASTEINGDRVPSDATYGYGANSTLTSGFNGGDGIIIIKWRASDKSIPLTHKVITEGDLTGTGIVKSSEISVFDFSNISYKKNTISNTYFKSFDVSIYSISTGALGFSGVIYRNYDQNKVPTSVDYNMMFSFFILSEIDTTANSISLKGNVLHFDETDKCTLTPLEDNIIVISSK